MLELLSAAHMSISTKHACREVLTAKSNRVRTVALNFSDVERSMQLYERLSTEVCYLQVFQSLLAWLDGALLLLHTLHCYCQYTVPCMDLLTAVHADS